MASWSGRMHRGVIEDARQRHRRERRHVLVTLLAIAAAALVAYVRFGAGGTPRVDTPGPGIAASPLPVSALSTTYLSIGGASSGTTTSKWSASVTVSRIAGTHRQRAQITVSYECSPSGPACRWSSEASQTASGTCPAMLDAARSIWTGPPEPTPGTDRASITFQPMHGVARPHVCVYVNG